MTFRKSAVNLIFGIVVAGLALVAGLSLFTGTNQPAIHEQSAPEKTPMPANTPPVDAASRIAALEQLMAREPQNPDYPAQIGNLYYDLGNYEKAADNYQRSLSARPRDPHVETDLATCFHYMGQDDKSLEILDNVLRYNPGFTQAKYNKGIVLIDGKKDIKGGISVWEELLRSDPTYSQKAELEHRIQELKASIRQKPETL
jgi:tetratricopeptide (TPR) repeat protein